MPPELSPPENGTGATPSPTPSPAPSAAASLEKVSATPAASSPAEGVDTGVEPGSATTPPVASPSATPAAPDYWGRIPEQRRNQILENARKEEAERVRRELQEKWGWADGITKDQVEQWHGLHNRLATDAWSFYEQLGRELREHPEYRTRFEPEEEEIEDFPQPDLWSEPDPKTGERKKTFSDQTLAKYLDIYGKRLFRQWQQQFAPVVDWVQQRDGELREQNLKSYTTQIADDALTEARQLPHFKEHEEEIGQRLLAIPAEVRNRIGAVACLYRAYNAVFAEKVLPGLSAKAQSDTRDQLTRKAVAAAGSVHPADGAAAAGAKKPTNVGELARHLAHLAGQT